MPPYRAIDRVNQAVRRPFDAQSVPAREIPTQRRRFRPIHILLVARAVMLEGIDRLAHAAVVFIEVDFGRPGVVGRPEQGVKRHAAGNIRAPAHEVFAIGLGQSLLSHATGDPAAVVNRLNLQHTAGQHAFRAVPDALGAGDIARCVELVPG